MPRSVEAVARHRHFTRAAEDLHLAQSALSHQIRRVDEELGTRLFERKAGITVLANDGIDRKAQNYRLLAGKIRA